MACVESDFSMMQEESDFEDEVFDSSDDENPAPPSKGLKPSAKSGGSGGGARAVLSPNQNKANVPGKSGDAGKSGKTIEDQYKKLSQREHVLVRPDTYIGSVEPVTETVFVLNPTTERLVAREITFTPGLFKIFDESKCCERRPVVGWIAACYCIKVSHTTCLLDCLLSRC